MTGNTICPSTLIDTLRRQRGDKPQLDTSVAALFKDNKGSVIGAVFTDITDLDAEYLDNGKGDFGWLVNESIMDEPDMTALLLAALDAGSSNTTIHESTI